MNKKKIVVCGATGNQGSNVVESLLKATAYEVVGISRRPNSKESLVLQEAGATIVKGDTSRMETLHDIFEGAYGVFGVTQPWSPDYKKCNVDSELVQGANIINAAKAANVTHVAMSSVLSFTDLPIGVKHADSKLIIEEQLKQSGLNYTILRCSQFLENLGKDFFPIRNNKIKGFVAADAAVPYISCKDIGKFATQIFSRPELHQGQTYDLIGDIVSGEDIASICRDLNDIPYEYVAVPKFVLFLFAREFFAMRQVFEKYGRSPLNDTLYKRAADFEKVYPGAIDCRTYLKNTVFKN